MTPYRLRTIRRLASSSCDRKVRELYAEVYGATPAVTVTTERVRASIIEATTQLLKEE